MQFNFRKNTVYNLLQLKFAILIVFGAKGEAYRQRYEGTRLHGLLLLQFNYQLTTA